MSSDNELHKANALCKEFETVNALVSLRELKL